MEVNFLLPVFLKIGISEGNENLYRQNTLQVINFVIITLLIIHLLPRLVFFFSFLSYSMNRYKTLFD